MLSYHVHKHRVHVSAAPVVEKRPISAPPSQATTGPTSAVTRTSSSGGSGAAASGASAAAPREPGEPYRGSVLP